MIYLHCKQIHRVIIDVIEHRSEDILPSSMMNFCIYFLKKNNKQSKLLLKVLNSVKTFFIYSMHHCFTGNTYDKVSFLVFFNAETFLKIFRMS